VDLDYVISGLRQQRDKLTAAISQLEELQRGSISANGFPKRRGRKSMKPEERLIVSERMKRYWAERRQPKV
jgi:hypothetical protein